MKTLIASLLISGLLGCGTNPYWMEKPIARGDGFAEYHYRDTQCGNLPNASGEACVAKVHEESDEINFRVRGIVQLAPPPSRYCIGDCPTPPYHYYRVVQSTPPSAAQTINYQVEVMKKYPTAYARPALTHPGERDMYYITVQATGKTPPIKLSEPQPTQEKAWQDAYMRMKNNA